MARSRISWNANQMRRIRQAVSSYNAAITRMDKSGLYDVLPNRTSVEREMELIETRDELRQRERELGRILVKNKQDALDPVYMDGVVAPKYLTDEIKLAVRTINERRKQQREALLARGNTFRVSEDITPITYEDMTPAQEYTMYSNKNLQDLHEEDYFDGDDLDDVWSEMYPQTYKYAENYKAAWEEYNGDPIVSEVIDYMAEHYPEELNMIFESGDDEVDINYIYSNEKSSDRTPMTLRHDNIIRYWNDVYYTYHGGDHPGYGGR